MSFSAKFTEEQWRRGNLSRDLRTTQKVIKDWWDSHEAVLSIIHARRGLGKTWLLLTIAFECMIKNPGWRIVYAAPSREMAKQIVIPTANLMIPNELPDSVRPVWSATDHAFVHPNGARCVVEGADDEHGTHLRGPFAHRVLMDELGFWRYPDYVYRSVLYPQVQRTGGRMLGVSTSPESPHHEFATILIPEAKSEGSYVKISLDDDPTVSEAEKDQVAAQFSAKRDAQDGRKSTQYRREYGCEIVTEAERAVLPEFDAQAHVQEVKRPKYFDAYDVMDIGFNDLTHALFGYYDFDNATLVVEREIARQYITVSELAPLILETERDLWGEKQPRKRVSDAQPISLAEFSRQHLLQPKLVPKEIRFAAVNNREPEALINRLRAMLAQKRVAISADCPELIKQCVGGLWNLKRTDFERLPGLAHLDGLMALAYFVDAVDYANNPRVAQEKFNREQFPVEFNKREQSNQHQALARLLPKTIRQSAARRS